MTPFGRYEVTEKRPARYFHAGVETHLGQHLLDLVERFAPEIREVRSISASIF
jgi:hypothetical protein